jgi:hypothetical protein
MEDKTFTQSEVDDLVAKANEGIERNRDKALTQLKDAQARLKAFDGVDPGEYRNLVAKVAELEQSKKAGEAGLTSEALAKLRSTVATDLVKQFAGDQRSGIEAFPWARKLADDNRALRLDSVVKAEMAKGGARAERIDALFKLTADRFDLTEDGKPMLQMNPGIEVTTYVSDVLKKEYPEFYNGSGSSGGGASKSAAGGGGSRTVVGTNNPDFLKNVKDVANGAIAVVE